MHRFRSFLIVSVLTVITLWFSEVYINSEEGYNTDAETKHTNSLLQDIRKSISSICSEELPRRLNCYHFTNQIHEYEKHILTKVLQPQESDEESAVESAEEVTSTKTLALILACSKIDSLPISCIYDNVEHRGRNSPYMLLVKDKNYPGNTCVEVFGGSKPALIEQTITYLSSKNEKDISDKQIEIISHILHKRYGTGQAITRVATVISEEITKSPNHENIRRLINHVANTYKP